MFSCEVISVPLSLLGVKIRSITDQIKAESYKKDRKWGNL